MFSLNTLVHDADRPQSFQILNSMQPYQLTLLLPTDYHNVRVPPSRGWNISCKMLTVIKHCNPILHDVKTVSTCIHPIRGDIKTHCHIKRHVQLNDYRYTWLNSVRDNQQVCNLLNLWIILIRLLASSTVPSRANLGSLVSFSNAFSLATSSSSSRLRLQERLRRLFPMEESSLCSLLFACILPGTPMYPTRWKS